MHIIHVLKFIYTLPNPDPGTPHYVFVGLVYCQMSFSFPSKIFSTCLNLQRFPFFPPTNLTEAPQVFSFWLVVKISAILPLVRNCLSASWTSVLWVSVMFVYWRSLTPDACFRSMSIVDEDEELQLNLVSKLQSLFLSDSHLQAVPLSPPLWHPLPSLSQRAGTALLCQCRRKPRPPGRSLECCTSAPAGAQLLAGGAERWSAQQLESSSCLFLSEQLALPPYIQDVHRGNSCSQTEGRKLYIFGSLNQSDSYLLMK